MHPGPSDPPLLFGLEQGLGDAIQFSRYLSLLDAEGFHFSFLQGHP